MTSISTIVQEVVERNKNNEDVDLPNIKYNSMNLSKLLFLRNIQCIPSLVSSCSDCLVRQVDNVCDYLCKKKNSRLILKLLFFQCMVRLCCYVWEVWESH